MTTFVGTQRDLVDVLNQLLELDFDSVEAYRKGIARLKDVDDQRQLEVFMGHHERHTRELTSIVRGLAHAPARGPDLKQLLTTGKVLVGSLWGDTSLLRAICTNEDDTNTAYERALSRRDLPQDLREILERDLRDERRHRAWLQQRVEALRAA